MKYALLVLCLLCSTASAQLMPKDREARIRQVMPMFASEEMNTVARDASLLFYTEREMPKAYQFGGGVHSPYYNIAANPDPHGNANDELPWREPAGFDEVENAEMVRFVWLPKQANGSPQPVRYRVVNLNDGEPPAVRWLFPVGAVVGELFTTRSPSGKDFAIEVRTRTKFADGWRMEVFRPYETARDLAEKLRALGHGDLADRVSAPLNAKQLTVKNPQPKRIFNETTNWEALPAMPQEVVEKLLSGAVFHECSDLAWKRNGDQEQFAPAVMPTDQFNVVPAGYKGAALPVSDASCIRCHNTTLHPADEFAPNISRAAFSIADTHREWYGRVRGSDGIFSFHPFDPSCISDNGGNRGVRYRQALLTAGIIAPEAAR